MPLCVILFLPLHTQLGYGNGTPASSLCLVVHFSLYQMQSHRNCPQLARDRRSLGETPLNPICYWSQTSSMLLSGVIFVDLKNIRQSFPKFLHVLFIVEKKRNKMINGRRFRYSKNRGGPAWKVGELLLIQLIKG